MLSGRRKHSFLLTFCAFIALLLMSASAALSAHARASILLQHAVTSVATDTHASVVQPSAADDSSGHAFMLADDNDLDDELVLPALVRVWLDYAPSAAPSDACVFLYPAPVASLLRPPSLA